MEKRERLEKTFSGEPTDRVPTALWRHWPGDDQRAADLARSTLEFQRAYDWDVVKITPSGYYAVTDYGVQTEWQGDNTGERRRIKATVKRSLQWTELRTLDPMRGELGKHLETVNLVCDALRGEAVPVITTIYSPLTQASMIGEGDMMRRNMRTQPDRLRTGLNIITESTLRLIDALKRTDVSGIFYVIDQADFSLMSEAEYVNFGLPYDRKILDTLPSKWWLNILHVRSNSPMFSMASTYPVQAINWDVQAVKPTLDKALSMFRGALCTGLSHEQHLHHGTPAMVRTIARDTIEKMHGRQLILSAGDAVPVTAPLSNLRAVREVVEGVSAV